MGFQISDGTGNGYGAKVNQDNQLYTLSERHTLRHHYSTRHGQSFNISGRIDNLAPGDNTVLHLKNDSNTRLLTICCIRVQAVDIAYSLPSSGSYFSIGYGTTYSSAGSSVTAVNMNSSSGNTLNATVYEDPTVTGTFSELMRWYVQANGIMYKMDASEGFIIGHNDTFEVRLSTESSGGVGYARVSMVSINPDET